MGFLISDKQLCSLFMVHYCPPVSIGGTVKKSEKSPSPNHHQTEPLETGEKGGKKKNQSKVPLHNMTIPLFGFHHLLPLKKTKQKYFTKTLDFISNTAEQSQ